MSWPHQVGVLPPEADCFQEREAIRALEPAWADERPGGGERCHILVGGGGVGKTQVAARHVRRLWHGGDLDLLVWVNAAGPEAITDAYAQAAASVLGADRRDAGRAAQTFLRWLGQDHGKRWLVVLDDVTQPADLHDLWPPQGPGGRTLVTTRNRDAAFLARGRARIEVGLFTPEESHDYVAGKLAVHGRADSTEEILALAEDFGHLPLALAQAVPYMVNKHLDCAAYRRRLADRRLVLHDVLADISGLPDGQRHTVAAAWSLSVDLADRLSPRGVARPLLEIAAMLDPNGIPALIFDGWAVLDRVNRDRAAETDAIDRDRAAETDSRKFDLQDVTCALWNLHQLSLVDHTPGVPHRTVRVHQLIQRAVREPLEPGRRRRLARTAADALADGWPDRERDADLAQALRSNTDVLKDHAERALHWPEVHTVLSRSGHSLGENRQVAAAREHFARLADAARRHLGGEHPDTLTARLDLAVWSGRSGDAQAAADLLAELLAPTLRVLGESHPQSLTVWRHLIDWREASGDRPGAATAAVRFLDHLGRVLGPDHPATRAQQASVRRRHHDT
ncbi:NB-ARC domain-containing protein [Streptomyces sp. NPDC055815]